MRLSWGEVKLLFNTPTFPCVISYATERLSGLRGGFKEEAVGREVVFAVAGESMGRLRTGVVRCGARHTLVLAWGLVVEPGGRLAEIG